MPILLLFIFLCCTPGANVQAAEPVGAAQDVVPGTPPSSSPNAEVADAAGSESVSDAPDASALPEGLDDAARVDFYCLRLAYPQITGMTADEQGQWLVFNDGRRVLYAAAPGAELSAGLPESAWVVSVKASMAEPYPLEPQRPDTPLGVSPGRRRSYNLLKTLYGATPRAVGSRLIQARLLGQRVHLAPGAAQAMNRASASLAPLAAQDPHLKKLLKMDGGFTWRRIAGENRLSPHAFGIAFDISPGIATYWRWSKLRPHPLQQSYPAAIVEAFEHEGFIWGGKWHEYDLMHFEYRPEIICKARMWQGLDPLPRKDSTRILLQPAAPTIPAAPAPSAGGSAAPAASPDPEVSSSVPAVSP